MDYTLKKFSGTNFEKCFILGRWSLQLGCLISRFSFEAKYTKFVKYWIKQIRKRINLKAIKSECKGIHTPNCAKSKCKRISSLQNATLSKFRSFRINSCTLINDDNDSYWRKQHHYYNLSF